MDLQTRCLVAVVRSHLPGQHKSDSRITREVARENGATDPGRWSNKLWPKEALLPAQQIVTKLGALIDAQSVPWLHPGQRLILGTVAMRLRPQADKIIREFITAAEASGTRLQEWISTARHMRGNLFRPSDYPYNESTFVRGFRLTVSWLPVPDESHMICALAEDDIRHLRESVQSQVQDALTEGRADVVRRLSEPLSRMITKLRDPNGIFRDSLVSNLRFIADAVPELNFTGDVGVSAIASACATLADVAPDNIRQDGALRADIATRAEALLAKLDGLPA